MNGKHPNDELPVGCAHQHGLSRRRFLTGCAACAGAAGLAGTPSWLNAAPRLNPGAGKLKIRIGIGVASGQVIAGYTGTVHRATYTCVGDTVNLAARLESHTKVVGEPILIDETTRLCLANGIKVIDQGLVQVKGKTQEVRIFSVPIDQKL